MPPPAYLTWSKGAEAVFKNRRWNLEEAARVDEAVQNFARTGEGDLVDVPGDPKGFRLLVPPYEVRLEIDEDEGTITVLDVCTMGWQRR